MATQDRSSGVRATTVPGPSQTASLPREIRDQTISENRDTTSQPNKGKSNHQCTSWLNLISLVTRFSEALEETTFPSLSAAQPNITEDEEKTDFTTPLLNIGKKNWY